MPELKLAHSVYHQCSTWRSIDRMKPAQFQYQQPETLEEAVELLADTSIDTQLLAGGQSLMPMMNLRVAQPDCLVDLNAVPGLAEIVVSEDSLKIGAMTRYAELEQSTLVEQYLPLITEAIPHIAHSAIRNRGTIGGSAALADPAAEMPALLLALDASIHLLSKAGEREIAASDFFIGMYETARREDELLVSFDFPISTTRLHGFYEIVRRHGDYASAGVALTAHGVDPLDDLRIVMFGVSDRPERLTTLEQELQGLKIGDGRFQSLAAQSLSTIDYADSMNLSGAARAHFAEVALKRAFVSLAER